MHDVHCTSTVNVFHMTASKPLVQVVQYRYFQNISSMTLPDGSFVDDVFKVEFVVFLDVFVERFELRIEDGFFLLDRLLEERFLLLLLSLTLFLSARRLGSALGLQEVGDCASSQRVVSDIW